MNITTDKMPHATSEVASHGTDVEKDRAEYSRLIASAMSKRMKELGLTQRMLTGKMNCTQQYISKVLKGEKNMSLETICKIESALGIEIIKGLNENEHKR